MIMDEDKRIRDSNEGRLISIAWKTVGPVFTKLREAIIIEQIHAFSAGKTAHEIMAIVAKLVVLQQLEDEIRLKISIGERATKQTLE